jgi:hypothetical protein
MRISAVRCCFSLGFVANTNADARERHGDLSTRAVGAHDATELAKGTRARELLYVIG